MYLTSVGKGLSNDTKIGVISSIEPEICTKMLRNLHVSEKLREKLPATTHGYSMEKLPASRMLSRRFLNWKQAHQKVNHCSKKIRKGEKGKEKKVLKKKSLKVTFSFKNLKIMSKNVIKHNASGKKYMLSYCKCICKQIGANLAHIQPENLQNVQKMHFSQEALGVRQWFKDNLYG